MIVRYFLLIDGLDGDSTDANHVGWFDLNSFDLDLSRATSAATGAGTGVATFSPLVVNLNLDPALSGALADIAKGSQIKSIRIEGVTGSSETAVYDLTLADVAVTQLQERNGGNDTLSFAYQRLGLVTQTQNANGSFSPGSSFGFDVATETTIDPTSLPAPTPGSGPASTPATKYFLAIDGLDGGSSDAGHVGWFDLNSFEFDLSRAISAATGGGFESGVATFSPLVINLNLDPALSGALADIAKGSQIKSIKIEGVTETGQAVYDLTLADVGVTQLHDANSGNDALSFAYQRLGLVTQTQNADGSFSPGSSFGFDVATETAIDPTSLPAPSVAKHLVAELVSTTTHGQLTLNPDGSFVYIPNANFSGTDSFVYRTTDGITTSNDATISITVADRDVGEQAALKLTIGNTDIGSAAAIAVPFTIAGLDSEDTGTVTFTDGNSKTVPINVTGGQTSYLADLSSLAGGTITSSLAVKTDPAGNKFTPVAGNPVTLDPGPSVNDTTTAGEKVAHGATVAVGTAAPGLSGDTLTLNEISGPPGAVTLSGGVVNFVAPANASGPVTFSYQISDQLGDVSAVISDTLTVDPGPTAGNAHLYLSPRQSTNLTSFLLALDTPGLPGDTLTLSAVGTARGTVSLSNGNLSYTAPASGSSDAFTYTVSDQLHETAIGSVSVSLLGTSGSIALTGSGNSVVAGNGNYSITGGAGGSSISLGNGNDSVSLSGNNNTVVLGGGNDSVSLSGNNNTTTLGNGNDSVTAGANNTLTLGNGNDTIYAGAGDTITLGSGHDTVYAGPGDTITLGSGNDLLLFGVSPSPSIMDTEIVNGFNPNHDIIEFNRALFKNLTVVLADAKQVGPGPDTIITHDPNDTVTLHGVALAALTANNIKIV